MQKLSFNSVSFGRRVKSKRVIENDYELRDVSKKVGVSIATLSRIENGKLPDVETMLTLCKWIKADPFEFVKKNK